MIIFIIGASPLESHIDQFIKDHETDTIYTVSLDELDELEYPTHFYIDFNDKSNWQDILRDFRGEVDQIIFDWSVEKNVKGFGIIDIFYNLLKNGGKLYMYNGICGKNYHTIWVLIENIKMPVYFDEPPSEESCDFKCAQKNFGYFNRGDTPPYEYTGKDKSVEIYYIKRMYEKYNTLNLKYIKHKLEGNFKVNFFHNYYHSVYPIQNPFYKPNRCAERYVIATKIDKDESRVGREASSSRVGREASPSRVGREASSSRIGIDASPSRDKRGTSPSRDKRDTSTIRDRSRSRFKPKKKSKKVTTNKTKKSTTNKNKKLTTNKSKKTTKKKSLV